MIPLSCTHGKLHPGSATPRRLPRSLTCCVESLTAHLLHVKLLRYDFAMLGDYRIVIPLIPLSYAHGKLHPLSATPRRLHRSLTCCEPSLTSQQTRLRYESASLVVLAILKPRNEPSASQKISSSLVLQVPFAATGDPRLRGATASCKKKKQLNMDNSNPRLTYAPIRAIKRHLGLEHRKL